MARALRLERPGGRYHVTVRGNERKDIFRDDTDHFHFWELLSELRRSELWSLYWREAAGLRLNRGQRILKRTA